MKLSKLIPNRELPTLTPNQRKDLTDRLNRDHQTAQRLLDAISKRDKHE